MTSAINNIDIFNESAALILSELYKNVPVPTTLNYHQLASQVFADEKNVTRERILEVFLNTITWLKKSGFIWLDAEGELDAFGALLSPKGLESLSVIQNSSNNQTIGMFLVDTKEQHTQKEKSDLIKLVLSTGISINNSL